MNKPLRLVLPSFLGIAKDELFEGMPENFWDSSELVFPKKRSGVRTTSLDEVRQRTVPRTNAQYADMFAARFPVLWEHLRLQYIATHPDAPSSDEKPLHNVDVLDWIVRKISDARRQPIPSIMDRLRTALRTSETDPENESLGCPPIFRPTIARVAKLTVAEAFSRLVPSGSDLTRPEQKSASSGSLASPTA